jgi:hypothetical protein
MHEECRFPINEGSREKHSFDKLQALPKRVTTEEHPTNYRNEKRIEMTGYPRLLQPRFKIKTFLKADESTVPKTPEDERPICTMPNTRQQPHNEKIEHQAPSRIDTTTSQGEIDIIPEPAPK